MNETLPEGFAVTRDGAINLSNKPISIIQRLLAEPLCFENR